MREPRIAGAALLLLLFPAPAFVADVLVLDPLNNLSVRALAVNPAIPTGPFLASVTSLTHWHAFSPFALSLMEGCHATHQTIPAAPLRVLLCPAPTLVEVKTSTC